MSVPFPPSENHRLEELRRYSVLDTPPEKAFDHITELAARIFKMPISSVTLIDENRQWFKSCFGLETREVGRNFIFCSHAIIGTEVMVVPDASIDPRFADNPLVTGEPHICFYAGAPLRTSNGLNLGTLCVIDTKPRDFTKSDRSTLSGMATFVVKEIELRYQLGERRRDTDTLSLMRSAIEQSSESIVITTAVTGPPGPEIVFVNPAFTSLTGYSAVEAIGKTPRIFEGPKTDPAIFDRVSAELANGEEFHFDMVHYCKDGSELVLACHISPIRADSGKITHYICFQRDATERNRQAAVIQDAKEEAERANRAKSEFLSRMSHELRTPLHAILGFAQLLEMDGLNVEDKESVAQIARAGNHLLELINEVLDIARVQAGKLALTPEPVSVRETLEEALSLIKPLAADRRVRIEPIAGDPDCEVLSSARRFTQVILNLLSNAVKFNREGGTVTVTCRKFLDCLRIEIADTGLGISAGNIEKLFVPFERLDVGDSVTEGAGLGLSLSKHLVEAMGGKIGVESVIGKGTTFWVELPLVVGTSSTTGRILDGRIPSVPNGQPRAARITLLYIEDNLSNLRLAERILARRPLVKLISAMQGSIGLDLARQHHPDLILLDLHLPDIQGDEILRQLSADPRTQHIPVVMISADATSLQIDRLRAAGANDYLTKPIDVRRLLAVIDATEPCSVPAILPPVTLEPPVVAG